MSHYSPFPSINPLTNHVTVFIHPIILVHNQSCHIIPHSLHISPMNNHVSQHHQLFQNPRVYSYVGTYLCWASSVRTSHCWAGWEVCNVGSCTRQLHSSRPACGVAFIILLGLVSIQFVLFSCTVRTTASTHTHKKWNRSFFSHHSLCFI